MKNLPRLYCRWALLPAILSFAFALSGSMALAQEDLEILDDWIALQTAVNPLYGHWNQVAGKMLGARSERVRSLSSREEWLDYQSEVRAKLGDLLGPFPERTPLNARITGIVEKEGFRIEKVLFQSLPEYWVSAALFLPSGVSDRRPAIIFCSGHSEDGFRSDVYQTMILNLVAKGFVVFAFDPVGQGERLQYYDPANGDSLVGGATREHSYAGAQAFLAGISVAKYFVWDGIRAIDYVVSRPEVDPERIGIMGRSGGGTQSAYIAAVDDRIKAAAPECYITTFERLLQSIGPQDAEQNLPGGIAAGIDLPDFLIARAPKPTIMVTTTRDFFSIQGAREARDQVARAFQAFQEADAFSMVEDDAPHQSTPRNRESVYRFFQRWLELPGSPEDRVVSYLTGDELRVTSTGQVLTSVGGRSLHEIIRDESSGALERLHSGGSLEPAAVVASAICRSGLEKAATPPESIFNGRWERNGTFFERHLVRSGNGYWMPLLMAYPVSGRDSGRLILYLDPSGKAAEAGSGGLVEKLAQTGHTVIAADLYGAGELAGNEVKGDAYDFDIGRGAYNIWFLGMQIGESIAGTQASDILGLAAFARTLSPRQAGDLTVVARGTFGPAALHAAAAEPSIERIAILDSLVAYSPIVTNSFYKPEWIHSTVPASLQDYDLPLLLGSLAPRPLLVANPRDQMDRPLLREDAEKDLQSVAASYRQSGRADALEIAVSDNAVKTLLSWLD